MIEVLRKTEDGFVDKDEVFYRDRAEYLHCGVLKFCGCGDSMSNLRYIQKMLRMLDEQQWGDYEDAPYMFFVYWADGLELAEHGTTVRCSWLTEKGKKFLADIESVTQEEDKRIKSENKGIKISIALGTHEGI